MLSAGQVLLSVSGLFGRRRVWQDGGAAPSLSGDVIQHKPTNFTTIDGMARRTRSEGAARGVKGLSASKGQGFPFAVHDGDVQLQMFRSLADHSQEFIGMCDLGFKPFYVNEAGLRMVGLSSLEEACAVRVQDFFFPEDQHYICAGEN